jgi:hypothetical protein
MLYEMLEMDNKKQQDDARKVLFHLQLKVSQSESHLQFFIPSLNPFFFFSAASL